jgi:hypothetical protein
LKNVGLRFGVFLRADKQITATVAVIAGAAD